MQKINCTISNCSHNKNGICYSNKVDIGGVSACSSNSTCCGSFLDKSLYSCLTSNANSNSQCDCLVCTAENCSHNINKTCELSSINICGNSAKIYTETKCCNFELS